MIEGYEITKEIKAKTRVYKYIYVQDFFFLIIYAALTFILSAIVYTAFVLPFYIVSGIFAIILILPSPWNPGRKIYMSIIIMLHKDYRIYAYNSLEENSIEEEAYEKYKK